MLQRLFNREKIDIFKNSTYLLSNELEVIKFERNTSKLTPEVEGEFTRIVSEGFKKLFKDAINKLSGRKLSTQIDVCIDTTTDGSCPFKLLLHKTEQGYIVTAVELADVVSMLAQKEELLEWALLDPLTGLLNRRGFSIMLENMVYRASREGKALGLIYFDMDALKSINTQYGHEGGDKAIKRMAEIMKLATRKTDILARFGGDEFVIVFETDPKKDFTVDDMAERILKMTRATVQLASTVSIGAHTVKVGRVKELAESDNLQKEFDRHLQIADEYSMKAKSLGKDQYISESTNRK